MKPKEPMKYHDVRQLVGQKVELFVVQFEHAPPCEGMETGMWSNPKEVHGCEDSAQAEIAGERAKEEYCGAGGLDGNIYRIVKLIGTVVSVDVPKPHPED